ncbi:MAG: hypothetical protein WBL87_03390, partial [Methanothrix sp.]
IKFVSLFSPNVAAKDGEILQSIDPKQSGHKLVVQCSMTRALQFDSAMCKTMPPLMLSKIQMQKAYSCI